MKRKNVFWLSAGVLVLLMLYGVWHYSPLRYLTRSQSQSQPIIITKKILPETAATQQSSDLSQPVVVLKKVSPLKESTLVEPQESKTEVTSTGEETLPAAPEVSSLAKANEAQAVQVDKPLKAQAVQKTDASVKQKSAYPYSIMLSSCKLPRSARKVVSNYQKVGLAPYVVKVKLDKGDEWLRVLSGHYKTRQEALQAIQENRLSNAIVKKTPYTNLIGTYTSMNEMQAQLNQINALGYSPYFIKTDTGQFNLVVGAFVTKEGAENQKTELQSKGIQSTVIIR